MVIFSKHDFMLYDNEIRTLLFETDIIIIIIYILPNEMT